MPPDRLAGCPAATMPAWLLGCLVGCLAACLLSAWLFGCLTAWLLDCLWLLVAARMPGCLAAWLPGCWVAGLLSLLGCMACLEFMAVWPGYLAAWLVWLILLAWFAWPGCLAVMLARVTTFWGEQNWGEPWPSLRPNSASRACTPRLRVQRFTTD